MSWVGQSPRKEQSGAVVDDGPGSGLNRAQARAFPITSHVCYTGYCRIRGSVDSQAAVVNRNPHVLVAELRPGPVCLNMATSSVRVSTITDLEMITLG